MPPQPPAGSAPTTFAMHPGLPGTVPADAVHGLGVTLAPGLAYEYHAPLRPAVSTMAPSQSARSSMRCPVGAGGKGGGGGGGGASTPASTDDGAKNETWSTDSSPVA